MRRLPLMRGSRQRPLNRPPQLVQPRYYGAVAEPKLLCPLHDRERLSLPGKNNITSQVPALLRPRRPPNISWLIVLVAVDPIERMAWAGYRSHVSEERLERFDPLRADGDSAAPIIGIVLIVLVKASRSHVKPGTILRRSRHAVRHAFPATAALFSTAAKSGGPCNRLLPAIALTKEGVNLSSTDSASVSNDGQQAESLADKVSESWVRGQRNLTAHVPVLGFLLATIEPPIRFEVVRSA